MTDTKRREPRARVRVYPITGTYVQQLRDMAAELLRIADQMERQGFNERQAS